MTIIIVVCLFAEVRPVTPPQEDPTPESEKSDKGKHPVSERKITVANTDLLFKLFENIGGDEKKSATVQLKRGRYRRSRLRFSPVSDRK